MSFWVFVCLFMFCLHLCKHSMYVCNSHRGQEGALDLLELELLTV